MRPVQAIIQARHFLKIFIGESSSFSLFLFLNALHHFLILSFLILLLKFIDQGFPLLDTGIAGRHILGLAYGVAIGNIYVVIIIKLNSLLLFLNSSRAEVTLGSGECILSIFHTPVYPNIHPSAPKMRLRPWLNIII